MHIGRRRRRPWQWPMSGNRTSDLLQLAGVPSSNRAAADWLSKAIVGARSFHSIAKERPLAADHNERLADIEATAKKLTKQIERLTPAPSVLACVLAFDRFRACSSRPGRGPRGDIGP